ncbi:hypothetical protein DFH09DRAFT_1282048 [Mycena vulgaris]|nr:hypothetical protein DFH09DRAFT_1282048 [Mycena vulgaris]
MFQITWSRALATMVPTSSKPLSPFASDPDPDSSEPGYATATCPHRQHGRFPTRPAIPPSLPPTRRALSPSHSHSYSHSHGVLGVAPPSLSAHHPPLPALHRRPPHARSLSLAHAPTPPAAARPTARALTARARAADGVDGRPAPDRYQGEASRHRGGRRERATVGAAQTAHCESGRVPCDGGVSVLSACESGAGGRQSMHRGKLKREWKSGRCPEADVRGVMAGRTEKGDVLQVDTTEPEGCACGCPRQVERVQLPARGNPGIGFILHRRGWEWESFGRRMDAAGNSRPKSTLGVASGFISSLSQCIYGSLDRQRGAHGCRLSCVRRRVLRVLDLDECLNLEADEEFQGQGIAAFGSLSGSSTICILQWIYREQTTDGLEAMSSRHAVTYWLYKGRMGERRPLSAKALPTRRERVTGQNHPGVRAHLDAEMTQPVVSTCALPKLHRVGHRYARVNAVC